MSFRIQLHLDAQLYLRDPEQTELGQRIVDASIRLLDSNGFERFTFRKLAEAIGSTEASIYRYFSNKHRLLLYLVSWYWSWVEYRLQIQVRPHDEPRVQLTKAVEVLLESATYDPTWSHIDEVALHRVVVVESNKVYSTAWVDDDNAEGLFGAYKTLSERVAGFIEQVAPDYPFPHALASTVIEASHQQIFFAQHLPRLTEVKTVEGDFSQVGAFLHDLLGRVLGFDAVPTPEPVPVTGSGA
jgi:AcrR family transcriptional regulator